MKKAHHKTEIEASLKYSSSTLHGSHQTVHVSGRGIFFPDQIFFLPPTYLLSSDRRPAQRVEEEDGSINPTSHLYPPPPPIPGLPPPFRAERETYVRIDRRIDPMSEPLDRAGFATDLFAPKKGMVFLPFSYDVNIVSSTYLSRS